MSTSCTPCPQGQVTNTTGKTSPTDCQGKYISGSTESMETCHYIGYRGFFAYMFLFFTQHHLVKVSFCLDFSRIKIHASILQILHIIGQWIWFFFLFWNSPRFKLAHKWPWKWAKNKMGLTIIVFSLFYLPVSCNIRILDIRCTCNRVFIFFKNVWLAIIWKKPRNTCIFSHISFQQ